MSRIQLPATKPKRRLWNRCRRVGQKSLLMPKQIWPIRTRLELAGNLRDLALLNLAATVAQHRMEGLMLATFL